jgi:hypothetical protein
MKIRAPSEHLFLHDARDLLMLEMYDGIPTCLVNKVTTIDAKQAVAAAKNLGQAILTGQLDLFAIFSSRAKPVRLYNQALIEAAFFPPNSTVLTFAYVDRRPGAPFGLSWRDLKELTRDPLCVEKTAFHGWLKKESRKKAWPCHKAEGEAPIPRGRPPRLRDEAVEVIEELHTKGKLRPKMGIKEVHALVQKARPSLKDISSATVRRARSQASLP